MTNINIVYDSDLKFSKWLKHYYSNNEDFIRTKSKFLGLFKRSYCIVFDNRYFSSMGDAFYDRFAGTGRIYFGEKQIKGVNNGYRTRAFKI